MELNPYEAPKQACVPSESRQEFVSLGSWIGWSMIATWVVFLLLWTLTGLFYVTSR